MGMAKRGFFAELNYQAQQAEKRQRQQQVAAVRAHNAAVRRSEQAAKAADRARVAAQRSSEAERKAAEKEAKRLHVEAREAEVEELNTELTSSYEEIDRLLEATLEVDDYVDLESLKSPAVHPEFDPGNLALPTKPPLPLALRNAPIYQEPEPPKGLAGAFGGKKKHAAAVEAAQAAHALAQKNYESYVAQRTAEQDRALEKHAAADQDRLAKLAKAQEQYQDECRKRDAEAQARNEELTKFINDLAFDVPSAIEEYVGVVLSNSVYPDAFPVEYDHTFDLSTRELTLSVFVPEPASLPSVKEYRYVKAKDEIVATQLSAKAQKDRYASAVHETAVRTLHEVFEADRAAKIRSIALTVGVNRVAPATGLPETVPLVQVAAGREAFGKFDLANVVAVETLKHLGAALSKNPFDLTPADTGRGVRQQGK
jgi:restriction system protein